MLSGIRVWVEFLPNLERAANELPYLKEAVEDVVVRAAAHENCDWVRIR